MLIFVMDGPPCLVRLNITSLAHRCRSGAVHPIIASVSEAIQSHARDSGLLRRVAPRNDVRGHTYSFSRRNPPELCLRLALIKNRGHREGRIGVKFMLACWNRS